MPYIRIHIIIMSSSSSFLLHHFPSPSLLFISLIEAEPLGSWHIIEVGRIEGRHQIIIYIQILFTIFHAIYIYQTLLSSFHDDIIYLLFQSFIMHMSHFLLQIESQPSSSFSIYAACFPSHSLLFFFFIIISHIYFHLIFTISFSLLHHHFTYTLLLLLYFVFSFITHTANTLLYYYY